MRRYDDMRMDDHERRYGSVEVELTIEHDDHEVDVWVVGNANIDTGDTWIDSVETDDESIIIGELDRYQLERIERKIMDAKLDKVRG